MKRRTLTAILFALALLAGCSNSTETSIPMSTQPFQHHVGDRYYWLAGQDTTIIAVTRTNFQYLGIDSVVEMVSKLGSYYYSFPSNGDVYYLDVKPIFGHHDTVSRWRIYPFGSHNTFSTNDGKGSYGDASGFFRYNNTIRFQISDSEYFNTTMIHVVKAIDSLYYVNWQDTNSRTIGEMQETRVSNVSYAPSIGYFIQKQSSDHVEGNYSDSSPYGDGVLVGYALQ